MLSEFERLEDCPVAGRPVVLAGATITGEAFGSVSAFRWCSNARRCQAEHGPVRDLPACRLNHVEHLPSAAARACAAPEPARCLRVVVAPAIADLVPTFLENRRREARELASAVQALDFARLERLAQRMVGVGAMYGFDGITALGRTIRCANARKSPEELKHAVADYAMYLARVLVIYPGGSPEPSTEKSPAQPAVAHAPPVPSAADGPGAAVRRRRSARDNGPGAGARESGGANPFAVFTGAGR